eukprot:TRINITY_DN5637_c0_g1_i6.p1 TRINITY_DN5637_c0_g1~~TRINITY_DN5637_c0_g1_i6.p1  ORF type:complete len:144 (+),score=32.86 TRINITY_DN5637_c0_g1_i6:94-525(+)
MIPQAEFEPVPLSSSDGFALTPQDLEKSYNKVVSSGKKCRGLILCTPHNPTGRVFSLKELKAIIDWAESKEIHVLADEIYALSVVSDPSLDDCDESKIQDQKFVSVGELGERLGPYVHLLWGAAKDLSLSGARVGVMYTGEFF